ncbi:MAG: cupin domain-containing protein [Betaproteobacteria bacterium]
MRPTRMLAALGLALMASLHLAAAAEDSPELKWQFVAGVPRPIEMAVVSGDPSQPGPYVVRYRMPSGMKIAPHRYADERELTVIKGIFWLVPGESYNWKDMNEYKQGSVIVKEAGKPYFGWARTAVVIEEKGTGPSAIEYVHPEDDPRNRRARRSSSSE